MTAVLEGTVLLEDEFGRSTCLWVKRPTKEAPPGGQLYVLPDYVVWERIHFYAHERAYCVDRACGPL